MTLAFERRSLPETIRVHLPSRPSWLGALAFDDPTVLAPVDDLLSVGAARTDSAVLLRAIVRSAGSLDDRALRIAVRRAYLRIGEMLAEADRFAWRYWNYLPAIGAPAEIAATRYEVFNIGRFEALQISLGESFTERLAAASAVGHCGLDLVIDVLAGPQPGVPVENRRQFPSWRYTSSWGPRPPSFARAILVPSVTREPGTETQLLVSGTASIVGEDSLHPGDLQSQLDETCRNLAALVAPIANPSRDEAKVLTDYHELRLYVARERDLETVARQLWDRFPALERLEVGVADLCRNELLLEVEGVAVADA